MCTLKYFPLSQPKWWSVQIAHLNNDTQPRLKGAAVAYLIEHPPAAPASFTAQYLLRLAKEGGYLAPSPQDDEEPAEEQEEKHVKQENIRGEGMGDEGKPAKKRRKAKAGEAATERGRRKTQRTLLPGELTSAQLQAVTLHSYQVAVRSMHEEAARHVVPEFKLNRAPLKGTGSITASCAFHLPRGSFQMLFSHLPEVQDRKERMEAVQGFGCTGGYRRKGQCTPGQGAHLLCPPEARLRCCMLTHACMRGVVW